MSYLIWSNQHAAWWRPGSAGYTRSFVQAGRYSREEALKICVDAMPGASHYGVLPEVPVLLADILAMQTEYHAIHLDQAQEAWEKS